MNLSENIKKIRKENNLSQEQLAEKLGVSRQSVSKWESGQAYPEMDKVLQICDLFSLNMDELMKSDLKEVREMKQSRANINKYVDDFFGFITKTIDMFSSLKFKDKLKCIVEQVFIGVCLLVICLILGSLCTEIFRKIFGFLNGDFYFALYNIFQAIYLVVISFISLAVFLHVFKVRYLDYYIIVKEEPQEQVIYGDANIKKFENKISENKGKIELSKKQEKIVIRDPNHSGYKFLSGLLKCALFFVKMVVSFIGFCAIISLLTISFALVLPFLYIKAGYLFVGSIIWIISCLIINLVILKIILNFIISKKTRKSLVGSIFVCGVIFLGIGGGIIAVGITNIKYSDNLSSDELITSKFEIEMNDNLVLDISDYKNDIQYISSENENIIVEVIHSKHLTTYTYKNDFYHVGIQTYFNEYKVFDLIKAYVSDLNNYEIKDREGIITKIYTKQENIIKLKKNVEIRNYENDIHEREMHNLQDYYEKIIRDYQKEVDYLTQKIRLLEY